MSQSSVTFLAPWVQVGLGDACMLLRSLPSLAILAMYSSNDHYTPSKIHSSKRTRKCSRTASTTDSNRLQRDELLLQLLSHVEEDERKIQSLLVAYDLDGYGDESYNPASLCPSRTPERSVLQRHDTDDNSLCTDGP